jgi:flagellar protein FlbD
MSAFAGHNNPALELLYCGEVSQRTLDYRAAVLRKAWPEAASSLSAKSAYDAERLRDQAHHASDQ